LESFWFGAHGRSSLSKLYQKRLTESSILLPMHEYQNKELTKMAFRKRLIPIGLQNLIH
jgi:hypothetical protein